jgi:hypothetical protein
VPRDIYDADLLDDLVPDRVPIVVIPKKMKIVTEAEIMAPAGGWTRAQLAEWGVPWPPPKGWKQALIERERAASRSENLEPKA